MWLREIQDCFQCYYMTSWTSPRWVRDRQDSYPRRSVTSRTTSHVVHDIQDFFLYRFKLSRTASHAVTLYPGLLFRWVHAVWECFTYWYTIYRNYSQVGTKQSRLCPIWVHDIQNFPPPPMQAQHIQGCFPSKTWYARLLPMPIRDARYLSHVGPWYSGLVLMLVHDIQVPMQVHDIQDFFPCRFILSRSLPHAVTSYPGLLLMQVMTSRAVSHAGSWYQGLLPLR